MKSCVIIQFAYLYAISASFSYFKPDIKNDDVENHASEFDDLEYKTSLHFLKNTDESACFSPICCLYNILLMCEAKEFGEEKSALGKGKFSNVSKAFDAQGKIFKLINCLFTKEKPIVLGKKGQGWRNENYKTSGVPKVFTNFEFWLKEKTEDKIKSPIEMNDLRNFDRIYLTFALFKDDWATKFEDYRSQKFSFRVSKDICLDRRTFMWQKNKFKHEKIETAKISYHVVALPYAEKDGSSYKRYMVYLIPIKINGKTFDETTFGPELQFVWENFYNDHCKKKLKKAITELKLKEIDLYIPQIDELKSEFNMINLINDILKPSIEAKIKSTIKSFFNVNEKGTGGKSTMALYSIDLIRDSSSVVANVPHILFIFDMSLEKILFITKYLG